MNKRAGNKVLSLVLALSLLLAVFHCDILTYAADNGTNGAGKLEDLGDEYRFGPYDEDGVAEFQIVGNTISYTGIDPTTGDRTNESLTFSAGTWVRFKQNTVVRQTGTTDFNIDLFSEMTVNGNVTGMLSCRGTVNLFGTLSGQFDNYGSVNLYSGCDISGAVLSGTGSFVGNSIEFKSGDSFGGSLSVNDVIINKGFNSRVVLDTPLSITFKGFSDGSAYSPPLNITSHTKIYSDGASFNYNVDGGTMIHQDGGLIINGKTADWLAKSVPNISASMTEPFLYGTYYDITSYVITNSDGRKSAKYADLISGDTYTEPYYGRPTEVGVHKAYISVEETSTYREIEDWDFDYNIVYLTEDEAPGMGASFSDTPVLDDGTYKFYNAPVTLNANSGFYMSVTEGSYSDRHEFNEDGYYNGLQGRFRRAADDATTDVRYLTTQAFYIDSAAPEVIQSTAVDQDGNALPSAVADGAEFHARSIEFDIHDIWNNATSPEPSYYAPLQSVTVNGEAVTVDTDANSAHVVLSTPRGSKDFNVVAKDRLGNTLSFTVTLEYLKRVPTATMTMDDSFYGAALATPVIETDSDQEEGNYIFYYKPQGADDEEYTTEQPASGGAYTVKVEIPFTDYYATATATADFSIRFLQAPSERYTLSGTKGKNDYFVTDVAVVAPSGYEISDSVDGSFASSINYRADLTRVYYRRISDGAKTVGVDFNEKLLIDKDAPQFASYGKDQSGRKIEISNGAEVHARRLTYSVSDENLATVTVNGEETTVEDGTAVMTLVVPDDDAEFSIVAEDIAGNKSNISFRMEVVRSVATASLNVNDTYYGSQILPEFTTNSNAEVVYYFKKSGTPDSEFGTAFPTDIGDYVVEARLAKTDDFTAVSVRDTFSIKFLETPAVPYELKAEEGKNGYYKTDVVFNAPEGFKICESSDGVYKNSVVYVQGMTRLYLRRNSDGAKTASIAIPSDIKIDKVLPVFEESTGMVQDGASIFADEVSINAMDLNLVSLTLDGKKLNVKEGTNTITLSPENGVKSFKLVAEDIAGNVTTLEFTLMAEWLRDRIIPAEKLLPLGNGEAYKLSGGQWTVSGDSTVYTGGREIYVNTSGNYTFTKVK